MTHSAYAQAVAAFRANRIGVAQEWLGRAISQDPRDPGARHLAGVVALTSGRLREAEARFREALRLFPEPAGESAAASWVGLGRVQLPQGRLEQALSCFDKAVRLAPGFAPAHAGRAAVLCDLGDYRTSEREARRALESGDEARTRLVLARALMFQSRMEEAEPILETLAGHPDVQFAARFHLAGSKAARGRAGEAEEEFRSLLREQPGYPGYLELSRTKRFRDRRDADLEHMHAVFEGLPAEPSHLSDVLRTDLCFAMAKAYDDLDDAGGAWPLLERANRLRAAAEPFDFASFERRVERFIAAGRFLAGPARPDESAAGAAPLVIAALPRSGSSLLEQMLAGHAAVSAGGEFSPFIPLLDDLLDRFDGELVPSPALASARRNVAGVLGEYDAGVRHVTDKSPVAFLYAGLLGAVAPQARFIHLQRHPLDTALSQYSQSFARGMGWTYGLESIARYHATYERIMSVWRECLGERLLEVSYEALVTRPEHEIARILRFCGLEYEPACLAFPESRRAVWTASGIQVRERLGPQRIGRWRRYATQLRGLSAGMRQSILRYEERLADSDLPY